MKRSQPKKRQNSEFKSHAYEASLTKEELEQFHDLLRSDKKVVEMRDASIPWRDGQYKGQKPCLATIYEIRARLDLDEMLYELEGTAKFVEGTRKELNALLKGTDLEKVLDHAMALIGQEVIYRTMKRLNPVARTAAAKLLLKRADQRRVDRRLDMVESEIKKDEPAKNKRRLTPDQKQQRIRQILGTE